MKKGLILGFALALTALTGLGATASARQMRSQDFTGVWQLDARQGGVQQGWGNDRGGNGNWDRGRDDNWGRTRERERGSQYGQRGYDRDAMLPDVIQIERDRRELRVENQRGRLLREIATGRRDARDGRLMVETVGDQGQRIRETFTLEGRGRQLVVRTVVMGARGSREFTSVYQRA